MFDVLESIDQVKEFFPGSEEEMKKANKMSAQL